MLHLCLKLSKWNRWNGCKREITSSKPNDAWLVVAPNLGILARVTSFHHDHGRLFHDEGNTFRMLGVLEKFECVIPTWERANWETKLNWSDDWYRRHNKNAWYVSGTYHVTVLAWYEVSGIAEIHHGNSRDLSSV